MIFRSCLGTVGRYSRARVRPGFISSIFFLLPRSSNVRDKPLPTATMAGRVFTGSCAFSSMSVNSRNNKDRYASTEAATMRRMINTMKEDEKQLEIEKSSSSLDESLLNSVVEVSRYSTEYNKFRPWLMTSGIGMVNSASGFAISGKKILTNAHVVTALNAITHVSVRKRGSRIEYKATVRKISHECDLAMLEIDDTEFWEDMEPLEFGDMPPLEEVVSIVGYPNGIDKICITKGFVCGVTTLEYAHRDTELLAILIDTSRECGNSGGPVLMGSKVIGVLWNQSVFGNNERITFEHLVSMKKPGETVLIKVLRKEKELEYNITLKPVKPHVKVQTYHNNLPSYYIFGRFVFVPLTKSYNSDGRDHYKTAGEEQVIISWVYSDDDINERYNSYKDLQVVKVNEVKVKNLKHLCELIEGCCTKYLRLDLEDTKVMILNYESAKKATSGLEASQHNVGHI